MGKGSSKTELANKIKSLRTDILKLSQRDFAAAMDMRHATVSAWESGSAFPSADALIRLGNLAPFPECLSFWEAAGLKSDRLHQAVDRSLKRMKKGLTEAALGLVPVPIVRDPRQLRPGKLTPGSAFSGFLLLPKQMISSPGKTFIVPAQGEGMSPYISNGFPLIVDISEVDFADKLVAAYHSIDSPRWPKGLHVGRVVYIAVGSKHVAILHRPGMNLELKSEAEATDLWPDLIHDKSWRIIGRIDWWIAYDRVGYERLREMGFLVDAVQSPEGVAD